MSKKYFTKYLPVEGKIEIGDKFIDTGVMNFIGTRTNKEGVYDFQKVKLFLCSRDIHLGEPPQGEYIDSRVVGTYHIETTKVIGEVSPDALGYVKEGDEFDEDEVSDPLPDMDINFEGDWFDKGTYKIRIKGRCGHFH